MKIIYNNICVCFVLLCLSSCGKEFLEVKADKSQQVPSTIPDFQALMDNVNTLMNVSSSHELGIIGADEYFITDARYQAFPLSQSGGIKVGFQKRAYTWEQNIYEGGETSDWNLGYARILWTNISIDGLDRISPAPSEEQAWNNAKGCALFHRALNYYNLAQLYCKAFSPISADRDKGLPLRREAGVTVAVQRSSILQTYQFILKDLEQAIVLLPDQAVTIYRPGKAAVYALLSKVYLQMEDYVKSVECAQKCLRIKPQLMDFNNINFNQSYSFQPNGAGNPEILFMNIVSNILITGTTRYNADPELLKSYTPGDLRKDAYFYTNTDLRILFKGSYNGDVLFFSGLATDEVYLALAECLVRTGDIGGALLNLNILLKNRMAKTSFQELQSTDQSAILSRIISERRKELVMRGTRWEDLKRLNKELVFSKLLSRKISGTEYRLNPNDERYVWPIPPEAIALGGYEKNER